MNQSHLLINESPLIVLPGLAKAVGLNEAIILQQVFFWSSRSTNVRDGRRWVYNTYSGWAEQFPFWSEMTIRRAITNLEKKGLLLSTSDYNKMPMDKTKWYAINFEELNCMNRPSDQNEQSTCDHIEQSTSDQNDHSNNHRIPKTTQKIKEYISLDDLPHVKITSEEMEKLLKLIGSKEDVTDYLYRFGAWIPSQPKKKRETVSAYLTIRNWHSKDKKNGGGPKGYISPAQQTTNALDKALREELERDGTQRRDITDEVYREDVQLLSGGRRENSRMGGLF